MAEEPMLVWVEPDQSAPSYAYLSNELSIGNTVVDSCFTVVVLVIIIGIVISWIAFRVEKRSRVKKKRRIL